MTQVDSSAARHLGTPLDQAPMRGQGQAADVDATTPLPDGWGSFCSKADPRRKDSEIGYWYATAPWTVDSVVRDARHYDPDLADRLMQTVDAGTWPELHRKVSEQVRIYESLMWETEL